MRRFVLDSCALITYFRDEPGADLLENLFAQAPKAKFWLHAINLGEVYYDTLRTSGPEVADQVFSDVRALPIIIVWEIEIDFLQAVGRFKVGHRMSYADAWVLALAERESATVVSTDRHEFGPIETKGVLPFYWLR
jgi:predicted nucleic acid-binding protein